MSVLPPFPVDEATIDLIMDACLPRPEQERTSIGDLCDLYSEMAGSDLSAVDESDPQNIDGVTVLRDASYHYIDVILALATELKRVRNER